MFSPLDDACWYHEASVLRFSFDRLEMDSRDLYCELGSLRHSRKRKEEKCDPMDFHDCPCRKSDPVAV